MEVIAPILEDERMGLDVLSLTFEGDVALFPALGHPGKKKQRGAIQYVNQTKHSSAQAMLDQLLEL